MSFVTLIYPDTLPGPSSGEVRVAERRHVSDVAGLQQVRPFQFDYLATQSVDWLFTPAQMEIFYNWWNVTLAKGGYWFAATWPLPLGWVQASRRFIAPPRFEHVPGGNWRVSATTQIKGLGGLPAVFVAELWISSAVYSQLVIENYGVTGAMVKGVHRVPPTDTFLMGASMVSGTISNGLHSYPNWPPEMYLMAAHMVSGTIDTILRTYNNWPPEQYAVTARMVSGTIANGYVSYAMVPEKYAVSAAMVGGTIT